MNNLNDKYHFLHRDKEHFYLFELESTGSLIYQVFDINMEQIGKYTISNGKVIKYNLVLDNSNRINLIYLLEAGELFLCTQDGSNWTESRIATFDTKSNTYHQFEVLYINFKINIIYSYSNFINSEIISIHHMVLDKKVEEENNVIKYVLRKTYKEFFTDFDDLGTIHLIYNTTTNFESYIYHSFYSPYRGSWTSSPHELSTRGKENSLPYLFVDSKSNINTSWLTMDSKKYKLNYSRMPINGKDKYIWQEINLPISFNKAFTPIIYEENNLLKILCYDMNSITIITSNDFGITWNKKADKKDLNINGLISSTLSKDLHPRLKVKDVFIQSSKVNDLQDLYFDFIISNNTDLNIIAKANTSSNISDKAVEGEDLENPAEQFQTISNEIILKSLDNQQLILNKLLENQENILNELCELKEIIVENKPSLFNRLFKGN